LRGGNPRNLTGGPNRERRQSTEEGKLIMAIFDIKASYRRNNHGGLDMSLHLSGRGTIPANLDKVLTDFKARAQLFGTESEQHQEFMRLLEEADFTIITMGTSNFPKNGEVSSWSVMFSN